MSEEAWWFDWGSDPWRVVLRSSRRVFYCATPQRSVADFCRRRVCWSRQHLLTDSSMISWCRSAASVSPGFSTASFYSDRYHTTSNYSLVAYPYNCLRRPIRTPYHRRQSWGLGSRPPDLRWGSWGLHEILLYSIIFIRKYEMRTLSKVVALQK